MSKIKPEPKFRKGEQVRILDGKYIDDYIGGWVPEMKDDLYKIVTITDYDYDKSRGRYAYFVDEVIWTLDEKGIEPCSTITTIIELQEKIKELKEENEQLLKIINEWNKYAERRLEKGR